MRTLEELFPRGKRRAPRATRIARIAAKLVERERSRRSAPPKPLRRVERQGRARRMVAYDLETTPIRAGNPEPLYLTAYGAEFHYSGRVRSIVHLRDILLSQFLTPENNRARFVAWNGNKFDVFFIGAALLHSKEYLLRPYLTRNKALRGLKVIETATKRQWEFLDGMAMTLGVPKSLDSFLATFAPEYRKLKAPDWDAGDVFDPENPEHVRYAERDSEGLFHAMTRAEQIITDNFGQYLQPTIGNLGIRLFQANMPLNVQCWPAPLAVEQIIRKHVMRGGFCFCARKYRGPVWKYDLNQAYAAAMRETWLPSGRVIHTREFQKYARCGIYRVSARKRSNTVPFYVCDSDGKRFTALAEMMNVWLTSTELAQLMAERWIIEIHEGYYWDDAFTMREYVDRLEHLRMNAPGGPKSAQGEMLKAVGNNSYGKTVEELGGYELVMAAERPEGFFNYMDADEPIQHIWFKFGVPQAREYHQPQIGAFITAHVRMVVRRAILEAPDAWLYADTDCVMYSRPVTLPIDPKKYGLWKVEAEGDEFIVIAKKVYATADGTDRKAKGMTVKRLTVDDFVKWYDGTAPRERQIQRQNFVSVMSGASMFVELEKSGQAEKRRAR